MENEALSVILERCLDAFDELVAEHATAREVAAILEVDEFDAGGFVVLNGELVELDDGVMLFTDVVICDERSGGAEDGF